MSRNVLNLQNMQANYIRTLCCLDGFDGRAIVVGQHSHYRIKGYFPSSLKEKISIFLKYYSMVEQVIPFTCLTLSLTPFKKSNKNKNVIGF